MNIQIFRVRLRSQRLRLNLSQQTLAARIGMYQGYISSLECGKRPEPSATTVSKLAWALGVKVGWLLGDES